MRYSSLTLEPVLQHMCCDDDAVGRSGLTFEDSMVWYGKCLIDGGYDRDTMYHAVMEPQYVALV